MTQLLERAFAEAARLPAEQQDSVAAWLLEELASEDRWEAAFASSVDTLSRLADEALAEYEAGKTRVLEPEER